MVAIPEEEEVVEAETEGGSDRISRLHREEEAQEEEEKAVELEGGMVEVTMAEGETGKQSVNKSRPHKEGEVAKVEAEKAVVMVTQSDDIFRRRTEAEV